MLLLLFSLSLFLCCPFCRRCCCCCCHSSLCSPCFPCPVLSLLRLLLPLSSHFSFSNPSLSQTHVCHSAGLPNRCQNLGWSGSCHKTLACDVHDGAMPVSSAYETLRAYNGFTNRVLGNPVCLQGASCVLGLPRARKSKNCKRLRWQTNLVAAIVTKNPASCRACIRLRQPTSGEK